MKWLLREDGSPCGSWNGVVGKTPKEKPELERTDLQSAAEAIPIQKHESSCLLQSCDVTRFACSSLNQG
jgi:hypothetical protein